MVFRNDNLTMQTAYEVSLNLINEEIIRYFRWYDKNNQLDNTTGKVE